MRDEVISTVASTLRDINVKTAQRLAEIRLIEHALFEKEIVSPARQAHRKEPSRDETQRLLHHEAGHAIGGVEFQCDITTCRINKLAATGSVMAAGTMTDLEIAVYALCGPFAEIRYSTRALNDLSSPTYDFLQARRFLDAWNERDAQPPVTFHSLAKTASDLVDARWPKIQRIALALGSAGTLDDYEVRLFADAEYQP